MATINVGAAAIDRDASALMTGTWISKEGPADGSGTITLIKIYVAYNIEDLEVAFFELVDTNTFTTRSVSGNLGNFATGYHEIEVSMAIVEGDRIGCYGCAGYMERAASGDGVWREWDVDYIPCTNQLFTFVDANTISLHGVGETVAVGHPGARYLSKSPFGIDILSAGRAQ